ncbi:MAG: hypothetical protein LBH47_01185 [Christensenellaceae bacterium]|jgi:signal peptidase|nr:hypothetical protein [Christensenellaceae bacterium]
MRKALKVFLVCVFWGAMTLLLVNAVLSVLVQGYYPTILGKRVFYVQTGSMAVENGIPIGAVIIDKEPTVKDNFHPIANIEKLENKEVVVSFSLAKWGIDTVITHRIVAYEINENGEYVYVTRGDANSRADGIDILNSDIVGIYDGKYIPYLGTVLGFTSSIYGLSAIVLSFGSVATLYWIMGAKFTKKGEKESENGKEME